MAFAPSPQPAPLAGRRVTFSKRQNQILDALEELFLEQGFRSHSIGDLAAAARCSRSTLYELATSKEDLFLLVLERGLYRIDAEGRAAAAECEDPAEALEAFLQANIVVLNRTGAAFNDDIARYRPALGILSGYLANCVAWISNLIEEGIVEGRFRSVDSRLAAEIMISAAQRVSSREVIMSFDMPWTEVVKAALELILYGLVGTAAGRTQPPEITAQDGAPRR